MTQLSVPWGRDNLSIELPSNWTLLQVAQPALRSAGKDWPERVAMVLNAELRMLNLNNARIMLNQVDTLADPTMADRFEAALYRPIIATSLQG